MTAIKSLDAKTPSKSLSFLKLPLKPHGLILIGQACNIHDCHIFSISIDPSSETFLSLCNWRCSMLVSHKYDALASLLYQLFCCELTTHFVVGYNTILGVFDGSINVNNGFRVIFHCYTCSLRWYKNNAIDIFTNHIVETHNFLFRVLLLSAIIVEYPLFKKMYLRHVQLLQSTH